MNLFIRIEVHDEAWDEATRAACVAACPVDIFRLTKGRIELNDDAVDECTLCRRCLEVTPPGDVVITKLYSGETLTRG